MNLILRSSIVTGAIGLILDIYGVMSLNDSLESFQLSGEQHPELHEENVSTAMNIIAIGSVFISLALLLLVIGLIQKKKKG